MEKAGVPLVPGYHGADQADAILPRRGGAHRLSRADQGRGGRRRQGHAHRRARRAISPRRWPRRAARGGSAPSATTAC